MARGEYPTPLPLPLLAAGGAAERARRREERRQLSIETPASKELAALSLTPDSRLMNLQAKPDAPVGVVVGNDLDAACSDPSGGDAGDDLVMQIPPVLLGDAEALLEQAGLRAAFGVVGPKHIVA